MASLTGQHFDGNNGFTETRDNIQSKAGNITSFNEFAPSGEERIAKVLLWAFHTMGLCCTITDEYAMYRGGKLASRPDSIALYIAFTLKIGLRTLPGCCKSNLLLRFQ